MGLIPSPTHPAFIPASPGSHLLDPSSFTAPPGWFSLLIPPMGPRSSGRPPSWTGTASPLGWWSSNPGHDPAPLAEGPIILSECCWVYWPSRGPQLTCRMTPPLRTPTSTSTALAAALLCLKSSDLHVQPLLLRQQGPQRPQRCPPVPACPISPDSPLSSVANCPHHRPLNL